MSAYLDRAEQLHAQALAKAERLIAARPPVEHRAPPEEPKADPEDAGDAAIRAVRDALLRRLSKRDETGAGSGEGG